MAAAIKAINAKIRSNKVLDYFCSTRTLRLPSLISPFYLASQEHLYGVELRSKVLRVIS